MLFLLIVGLVLIVIGSVYAIRNPRANGEGIATQRWLYIAFIALGGISVILYGVLAIALAEAFDASTSSGGSLGGAIGWYCKDMKAATVIWALMVLCGVAAAIFAVDGIGRSELATRDKSIFTATLGESQARG